MDRVQLVLVKSAFKDRLKATLAVSLLYLIGELLLAVATQSPCQFLLCVFLLPVVEVCLPKQGVYEAIIRLGLTSHAQLGYRRIVLVRLNQRPTHRPWPG